MKLFTQKDFVNDWGPHFANRVLDYARHALSHGSVMTTEFVLVVAVGELLRKVDALEDQLKRIQDERRQNL